MYHAGLFNSGTNLTDRVFSAAEVAEKVAALRVLKQRIVLTSGTYDMVHVGHANYLEKAREHGDFLIVGVDSDAKVRKRKGEDRPVVPQDERLLMLAHMRHVDALVLKDVDDPEHHLMKMVRPDILIISETTKHSEEAIADMQKHCGKIVLLEPQAETSTSAQIRRVYIDGIKKYALQAKSEIKEMLGRLFGTGIYIEQARTEIDDVLERLVEKMRGGD